jgi:hypothetical protein
MANLSAALSEENDEDMIEPSKLKFAINDYIAERIKSNDEKS